MSGWTWNRQTHLETWNKCPLLFDQHQADYRGWIWKGFQVWRESRWLTLKSTDGVCTVNFFATINKNQKKKKKKGFPHKQVALLIPEQICVSYSARARSIKVGLIGINESIQTQRKCRLSGSGDKIEVCSKPWPLLAQQLDPVDVNLLIPLFSLP